MHHLRDQFETKFYQKRVYYYVFVFVHEVKLSEIDIPIENYTSMFTCYLGNSMETFVFEIPF